jgi:D-alanyl-D-alanine carboxypeptidase
MHGKREYMRNEVASLTKMMTAYTVIKLCRFFKMDPYQTEVKISSVA